MKDLSPFDALLTFSGLVPYCTGASCTLVLKSLVYIIHPSVFSKQSNGPRLTAFPILLCINSYNEICFKKIHILLACTFNALEKEN